MIFDEVSMFDFRGFFLSRLIVCDLNMPHMTVYLIPFHLVCVVYKFSQDKFQPKLVHV